MTTSSDFAAASGDRIERTASGSGPAPGLADLSGHLGVLEIEGDDATTFLQGQFTNDVAALEVGGWQYSAWCSPKGRMLANFVVARREPPRYALVLHASLAEAVRKRLVMFVLRSKVKIADASATVACLGVVGVDADLARAVAGGAGLAQPRRFADVDGAAVLLLPGSRLLALASADAASRLRIRLGASVAPAELSDWQRATIAAGVPVITQATTDAFVPQMANWDALGGVSFQKGCYTGQEIVARTQYLGRLKERLFRAHVQQHAAAPGERIFSPAFPDQASGTIVNAAPDGRGGSDVLAVLQLAAAGSGDLHLGAADGPAVSLRELPYALPAAAVPRGRLA